MTSVSPPAADESVLAIAEGGGKEVGIAALCQMQLPAQLGYGSREIAGGEIGLGEVAEERFQATLREIAHANYAEAAAGEVWDERIAHEQVAHGVQFPDPIAFAKHVLNASLQDGSVGLV